MRYMELFHNFTDQQYNAWIRKQETCLPRWAGDSSKIVAAHVRRASTSGVGMKPLFSTIPLSDQQHRYQHQHGETALINRCYGENHSRHEAHEIIDNLLGKYRQRFTEAHS